MNPATNEITKKVLRKQYMNNLNLEASNDNKNYVANKILQITGEEPVRPPDTSSIEDKFKNTLNLQTLVRSQLMDITDGTNANQIVDNLSVDMLQFVAQRMPSIIEDLKPKFALGIPAQVFISYVDKLKKKADATLDIEYGSSGQTPFSSAVSSPELDFGKIYEPRMIDETPTINPRNLNKETEFKTAFETRTKPDTSPFQALENVKSLADFKKLPIKDKRAWLVAKARGEELKTNSGVVIKPAKLGTAGFPVADTNVEDIVKNILGSSGSGVRMRGRGLKPRISVDTSVGIVKQKRYIPFGRYVINRHHLNNNDIVMIKTMKGGAISDLPSTKVSSHLSSLIQKLIAGKAPTFDDMNDLPMEDKHHLHRIIKKCDIDISVPTPNKDKAKEEMNKFDILKGEILAGNDNKEMVKNFKIMLLRFMNSGKIPRRQGQEILTDLVSMGY